MKALRKLKAGRGADYCDVPVPEAGPADLLVRVKATALCKSDIEVYEWSDLLASLKFPLPITMGHEFLGEVVEAGSLVKDIRAGDHIAGETHIPCGFCRPCRTGNRHICSNNMGVLGRSVDGSFAEYIRVPYTSAIKVDNAMPAAHGALMEPLATAVHSLMKADVAGKTVAILGCGTIGLMAVELARLLGAAKVIAVSTTPGKLKSALALGADIAVNSREAKLAEAVMEATKGRGVDAVIDNTGNEKLINDAVDILQIAGKFIFVGMVDAALTINGFMKRVAFRELLLTGIYGRRMYETWDVLTNILESGRLDLGRYVAAEIPLSEYEKGIGMFPALSGRVVMYP
jgi:threonine 3-dehydrogenase